MTIHEPQVTPVASAVNALVAGLAEEPWGQVTVSVYETGRVVALAPWLTGHADRVAHLLATQRADGGWGHHEEYRLVPTLSAVEALLAVRRPDHQRGPRPEGGPASGSAHGPAHGPARGPARGPAHGPALREAAENGLSALRRWLPGLTSLPDTPAIELIVLSLIERINEHLDAEGDEHAWAAPLPVPPAVDPALLTMLRDLVGGGAVPPRKLLHALEVVGPAARGAAGIRPLGPGTVGASPAATAAWLGHGAADAPAADRDLARRHLAEVARRHGGPVPCGLPITVFERGWVLSTLARAGIAVTVPEQMIASLSAAAEPGGSPAGPGLPADADTTSVALYALSLLGRPYPPDSLETYRTDTHFCTWQGEQGFSVTVNAHVLDAYGRYAADHPETASRHAATIGMLSALLRDRQEADGSWHDRWHASPYYATACCVLALDDYGVHQGQNGTANGTGNGTANDTVGRAVEWVLDSQREDGSWGLWGGTAEETAYALQMLLLTRPSSVAGEAGTARRAAAVARGHDFLTRSGLGVDDPPMWIDKDLYRPTAVVRAVVLSALYLAARHSAR